MVSQLCPDEARIARFAAGKLASEISRELEVHVEGCERCRVLIAELARSSTIDGPSPREYAEREAEKLIGRYRIEDLLGIGGMGLVYTARDLELGRRVALKLLRSSDDGRSAERRARLLREAAAMAALSSPHVVAVYDVGTHGDQVFIAMELVTGATVRSWLAARPRTWKEIVDVFVQAGRGLIAAHEAGIVHRDFKPDNVFVGDDGRVRVGDFGLAHAPAEMVPAPPGETPAELTETGTVMGTVRYMAPEQLEGRRVDAQSDQFAFCVSLFEALHGTTPYPGTTAAAVLAAFDRGIALDGKAPRKHPRWLDRIVERGLALDTSTRYSSMKELVEALAREPVQRRRIAIAVATAGVALAATGAAYALGKTPGEAGASPCAGGAAIVDGVWGRAARARVQGIFASSTNTQLRAQGERVIAGLDAYAGAWLRGHADACEATLVHGTQSAERMDLRMECLTERLGGLRALTAELAVDKADLWKAMQAVDALAPLSACADPKALALRHAPPLAPADRELEARLRGELSSAKAAGDLGNYTRSLTLADGALASSKGREWYEAEAGVIAGRMLTLLVRGAEATAKLHAAAVAADASKHDRAAAEARILLVSSIGYTQSKPDEAAQIVPYAAASIRRLGGDPQLEALLLQTRARVLGLATRYTEALPLIEEARRIAEQHDPDSVALAAVYNTLGNTLSGLGRHEEALAASARALAIFEAKYGPEHPQVAMVLTNRGGSFRYLARYDDSIASHQRAIQIREKAFGPDHVEVAAARTNLANTFDACGRHEEAYAASSRALESFEKALPAEHAWIGTARVNMVERLLDLGRVDETVVYATQILPEERRLRGARGTTAKLLGMLAGARVRTGTLRDAWDAHREGIALAASGADREVTADVLTWFGNALLATNHARDAANVLGQAVTVHRELYGADHHLTVATEVALAETQLQLGRRDLAVPALERAIAALANVPQATADLARARAALARASLAR